jgi:hypothetical protein
MRRDKQRELFIELINKQLEPFGKKYEDVVEDPKWFTKFKITKDAESDFVEYAKRRIMQELKLNSKNAENEVSWFILQWGLTIDPVEYNKDEFKIFQTSKEKTKVKK